MKKILFIALIAMGCGEEDDQPVFRIDDNSSLLGEGRLTVAFTEFETRGKEYGVSVPKNNMILRYVKDSNNTNDSKSYKEGDQLYIDIDETFLNSTMGSNGNRVQYHIWQQLAHGVLGTPWRDCGMMIKVDEYNVYTIDYSDFKYETLYNPSAPC